jgi:hypothetical protein
MSETGLPIGGLNIARLIEGHRTKYGDEGVEEFALPHELDQSAFSRLHQLLVGRQDLRCECDDEVWLRWSRANTDLELSIV